MIECFWMPLLTVRFMTRDHHQPAITLLATLTFFTAWLRGSIKVQEHVSTSLRVDYQGYS